jgi:predicted alpha/beta hydrolase family esterase
VQAVLVAHSFGVSVARDAALAETSRVVGIYMIDGFFRTARGTATRAHFVSRQSSFSRGGSKSPSRQAHDKVYG